MSVTIVLPQKVKYIIGQLEQRGYEAYAVGGCVRDSILSRSPGDWDITTSAHPGQVKEIFAHTIDTGLQHGTVTVMIGHEGFEVTTYRIDGEYEDARHPKEVLFTANLIEDLKRRDFTINAMAYNDRSGLVDAFDGIGDLGRGIIRCVGRAGERFSEDALRMLRAVRFAAMLDFSIEEETCAAASGLAENIAKVSAERVASELVKLLTSDHPEKIRTAYELGLTRVFLPEFDKMMETGQRNPYHCYTVGEHTIEALRQVPPDKVLRLSMLLHDVAKPLCGTIGQDGVEHFYGHPAKGAEMAKAILRRLKFDNDTIRRVCAYVRWHDDRPPLEPRAIRRAIVRVGQEQYPAYFAVKRADAMAHSERWREESLSYIAAYEAMYEEIMAKGQCLTIKDLAIDGKDLIALGMKPGREIGETLQQLLEMVLEHPERNTRGNLLESVIK